MFGINQNKLALLLGCVNLQIILVHTWSTLYIQLLQVMSFSCKCQEIFYSYASVVNKRPSSHQYTDKPFKFPRFKSLKCFPTYIPHKRHLKILQRDSMLLLRDLKLCHFLHAYHFKFKSFKSNISHFLNLVTPSSETMFSAVIMLNNTDFRKSLS